MDVSASYRLSLILTQMDYRIRLREATQLIMSLTVINYFNSFRMWKDHFVIWYIVTLNESRSSSMYVV